MALLDNVDLMRFFVKLGLARASDSRMYPAPMNVSAKTASYTILPTDPCGTLFTNRGAAGAVTFTLPAPTAVPVGWFFYFLGIADQNIIVATATVDTLVTVNDAATDSLAMSTASQKIGALMKVICDGTQWIAVGETVGITYTAAT